MKRISTLKTGLVVLCTMLTLSVWGQGNSGRNNISMEVNTNAVIRNYEDGAEISEECSMMNPAGQVVKGRQFRETAHVVAPGEEIVWACKARGNSPMKVLRFELEVAEGENFLVTDAGGKEPTEQEDGTWKAVVSPNAQPGHKLKYTVYFQIGEKVFKADPVIVVGSGDGTDD